MNWMRLLVPCTVLAIARASWVLPVPGKSSSSRCPSESMQVSASRMTCCLPRTAWSTLSTIWVNAWANHWAWSLVTVMGVAFRCVRCRVRELRVPLTVPVGPGPDSDESEPSRCS